VQAAAVVVVMDIVRHAVHAQVVRDVRISGVMIMIQVQIITMVSVVVWIHGDVVVVGVGLHCGLMVELLMVGGMLKRVLL